jgi:gluconolactonase
MGRYRTVILVPPMVALLLGISWTETKTREPQTKAAGTGSIVRLDPALDAIVPVGAQIEKVAGGFGFIEGPVWIPAGYLLFSDIPHNVIRKWSPNEKTSVFLEKSGYIGKPYRPIPTSLNMGNLIPLLIGSNGLTIDHQGRLLICEHGNRRVERLENDGTRTILADKFEGKRLNSPNDVVVKSDGAIYFTDPPFGLQSTNSKAELPFAGVFLLKDGKLQVIAKDLKAPNGIAFSPDEKYLYIDDSGTKSYLRYDVQPDDTIANGQTFYDDSKNPKEGVPDGIKIDRQGNIYATGPGGVVYIFSAQEKLLGELKPPEGPANLAWGDADGKMLYMAAGSSVYRIHLATVGIRP